MLESLMIDRMAGEPDYDYNFENMKQYQDKRNANNILAMITPGKNVQFWLTVAKLEQKIGGLTEKDKRAYPCRNPQKLAELQQTSIVTITI